MAEFYAIKSPNGEFSDFARSQRAAINRFLRRQDNWECLWIEFYSQGYEIDCVNIPLEEAERINLVNQYYRDSTKPVRIRQREPMPWTMKISANDFKADDYKVEPIVVATEAPNAPSLEPDFDPLFAVSELQASRFSEEKIPKSADNFEELNGTPVNYVDDFDEVSPSRVVSEKLRRDEVELPVRDRIEPEVTLPEVEEIVLAPPPKAAVMQSLASEARSQHVPRMQPERVDITPVSSFAEEELAAEEPRREPRVVMPDTPTKPGAMIDIGEFVRRQAAAEKAEFKRSETPNSKEKMENPLLWPAFIASEDDFQAEPRQKTAKERSQEVVVDLAEYEVAPVDATAHSDYYPEFDRQAAFSDDGLVSAPRVKERVAVDAKPNDVGLSNLKVHGRDAPVERQQVVAATVRSSQQDDSVEEVRVRPGIAGRRSVALPTKSQRRYTIEE
jgi:hypothetical protein